MRKFFPLLILIFAPAAKADITHKLSSSIQLTVNAAATQVERVGNSYSVSGNNVTTQYTPDGGSATNSIGSLTISSGVGSIPALSAVQATAGESFSFSQTFTQADALVTSAPSTGAVSALSNQTSTAAGVAGSLAGTIDSSSTLTLTAGGAGTTATGQFVSEISIR
ncbi:MAG: hypothetical protein CMF91_00385 [Candidatus Marinimicrobia bacterium]|nr:hypothetical protein [Candidatus Neomarinimicrobiota bacterium]